MLFTSFEFVAFMAAVLVLYYLLPKAWQWPLLLIASLFFYWCASPMYLIFVGVTTVSTYVVSRLLVLVNQKQKSYLAAHKQELDKEQKKAYKAKMKALRWYILLGCLFLNLGILSVTKYTNFVITNINSFLSGEKQLALVDMIVPMGISFYTFQTMGYIIDVYRGKQEVQNNIFKLALFVTFFPQMVQGPISRYGDLSQTLYEPHRFESRNLAQGMMRILWGYFKKVVIADRLVVGVLALVNGQELMTEMGKVFVDYNGAYVFVAMLFYAFQLYCDFTGGIDITIGIAQCMGIRLAENFELPYFSRNIKEYWNRWHITMGTWFTDYIFYPMNVSKPMLKLTKWSRDHLGPAVGKRVTVYLCSFVVWLTTGIWHGAAWNFIVWGLANWVVIMVSQELELLYKKFHNKFHLQGKLGYDIFQVVRTILLMSMIRMFDCYRDVPLTFKKVGSMFTATNWGILFDGSLLKIGLSGAEYILLGVCLLAVLGVSLCKLKYGQVREKLYAKHPGLFCGAMALLLVVILIFGAYGIGFDSSQFIYNQF